ncbi:MAG: NAD-dependent epimerase/dehydratase family protein [Candidatus Poribacteria bacterium]|nr:NAD-dependent epimerase/dehydratase family protein [Candidatus Poribacteria bacterium]
MADKRKVLVTGASGYIAGRMLPAFRERYDLVLLDVKTTNREGAEVEEIQIVDLTDPDRDKYRTYFRGVDTVVHCAFKGGSFENELANVHMAYNLYQICVEEDVRRVVVCSSNHAADYYEELIWGDKWDVVTPDMRPLSDNFYGWAKEAYEHLGFVFATGNANNGKKLQNVQVRIGAPRETILDNADPKDLKPIHRGLGAYLSARDQVQLFIKSIKTENIEDENGVPFQIIYGISGNSHSFWSIVNARKVIGYEPEDNSAVKFAERIAELMREAKGD